jgi:hypothetical protein
LRMETPRQVRHALGSEADTAAVAALQRAVQRAAACKPTHVHRATLDGARRRAERLGCEVELRRALQPPTVVEVPPCPHSRSLTQLS